LQQIKLPSPLQALFSNRFYPKNNETVALLTALGVMNLCRLNIWSAATTADEGRH
jgi:hypothetical protein